MIARRDCLLGAAALSGLVLLRAQRGHAAAPAARLREEFTRIEKESGGRLGVAMLDTQTGARAGHRDDERFPLCSTFKLLACAAVLNRVDTGHERLERRIRYEARQLVDYSPVTKDHAGKDGMTLAALCEAAMTVSDNTAANLILESLGGPQALTAYMRGIGDAVTRLDRIEPDLNEAVPGDLRDTTTPAAMVRNLQTLLLGDALSPTSKERLAAWLVANKTGDTRLRAGVPASWRAGDKTGTGERGTANDVGIFWPPGRAPLIITAYLTQTTVSNDARNAVIAKVARAVVSTLG